MAEDAQGRLWFAATEYLVELDGTTWRRYRLPFGTRTHSVQTHSLLTFPDGRIGVKVRSEAGEEQVLMFDPRNGRFEKLAHPEGRTITVMVPRGNGTFWVNTRPGFRVEIYDGKSFKPQFELPSPWNGNDVKCMLQDAEGRFWIGGSGGAAVRENGTLRDLRSEKGFSETGAFEIAELEKGQMLLGGRENLLHFDGHEWSLWRSGMDRVRMITKMNDGTLWVASGSGLHRFQNGNWLTNGEDEGLPSTAVSMVFQDSRGRVWAGTSRGLSLYQPEVDREAPAVGFAPTDNVRETGPEGHIRIFFHGADKWKNTPAGKLLFSYRLDSGAWSAFGEKPSATFDKLSPGTHTVLVRGMDRNANVREAASPYTFQVALPWYRQPGFFIILIAAGMAIAGLLGLAASNYRQRSRFIVELHSARMAAESASLHKSRFLANMSHEIRTPMHAITGMTELALEVASSEEQRDYLTTVQKASNALLVLLNDILDFSKVEAGKLQLTTVDFDLEESIRDSLRTLEVRAREKGLTLVLVMDPGVPRFVSGDDRRLAQIILNLVANGVKFSSSGEIRVEVRLISKTTESAELDFVVSDTGIGIPREKQQTIFGAFEQADGSTTRRYGGTGLGLAICAKLVDLMHGRLWVESPWRSRDTNQLVEGSAFHVALRLPAGKAPDAEQVRLAPRFHAKLRVLLAEDNPVNRQVAITLLKRKGHAISVATNGREALEIATRVPLDVVLMDAQMPEMDGLQATAAIREWEKGRDTRVCIVALTAHAMDGDKERFLANGFDLYLAKPFRSDELDAVLADAAMLHTTPLQPEGDTLSK
jgi:signal transduction histidine kinase/CheY-like chemotaxis protein